MKLDIQNKCLHNQSFSIIKIINNSSLCCFLAWNCIHKSPIYNQIKELNILGTMPHRDPLIRPSNGSIQLYIFPAAISKTVKIQHPEIPELCELYGVIFTDGNDEYSTVPTCHVVSYGETNCQVSHLCVHSMLLL